MIHNIKEVSETLNLSEKTINEYIAEYSQELKDELIEKQGITYITDNGINIIKIIIKTQEIANQDKKNGYIDNIGRNIIENFDKREQKQKESFQEELDQINKQNEKLSKIFNKIIGKESWIGKRLRR